MSLFTYYSSSSIDGLLLVAVNDELMSLLVLHMKFRDTSFMARNDHAETNIENAG